MAFDAKNLIDQMVKMRESNQAQRDTANELMAAYKQRLAQETAPANAVYGAGGIVPVSERVQSGIGKARVTANAGAIDATNKSRAVIGDGQSHTYGKAYRRYEDTIAAWEQEQAEREAREKEHQEAVSAYRVKMQLNQMEASRLRTRSGTPVSMPSVRYGRVTRDERIQQYMAENGLTMEKVEQNGGPAWLK